MAEFRAILAINGENPPDEDALKELRERLLALKKREAAIWLEGPDWLVVEYEDRASGFEWEDDDDDCGGERLTATEVLKDYLAPAARLARDGKLFTNVNVLVSDCDCDADRYQVLGCLGEESCCARINELNYGLLTLDPEEYADNPEESLRDFLKRAGFAREYLKAMRERSACWPAWVLEGLVDEETLKEVEKCRETW